MSKTLLTISKQAQHSTQFKRTLKTFAQKGEKATAAASPTFKESIMLRNRLRLREQQCPLFMGIHVLAIKKNANLEAFTYTPRVV